MCSHRPGWAGVRHYRTQLQRARNRDSVEEDPLDALYDPEMAQREFMMKALESDDDLTPTKVMKYWEQRKALEVSPQKLPTQETYYDKLKDDEDKMEALNDAYYRELKGSVGARAFYEWFKRNNEKQKESIENKSILHDGSRHTRS